MSQYHTTATMPWLTRNSSPGIDSPSELVSAQEVGDGNLNLVV